MQKNTLLRLSTFTITLLTLMGLSSCSNDTKSQLGLRKDAPDEFVVVSNPSLRQPPSFELGNVTQPHLSKPRNDSALNEEDVEFLRSLATHRDSEAKKLVDHEKNTEVKALQQSSTLKRTLSKVRGEGKDPVTDADSEDTRINDNVSDNRHFNDGKIKHKSTSTLSRMLED